MGHLLGRRQGTGLAALTVGVAVAALGPLSGTAAANSIDLSIEPGAPQKGKPFQLGARGTAVDGYYVSFGFAEGGSACASTSELEWAKRDSYKLEEQWSFSSSPEQFDYRRVYPRITSDMPFDYKNGVAAGHYRACGYLTDAAEDAPLATDRLEFTVGGTCSSATAKVGKAKSAVDRAKDKRKAAKQSDNSKKLKKAKKKLKKSKERLRSARQDRRALC